MQQEIAVLKETRNQMAVQHGLPPIGARMLNQYGIEWLVDGHLFARTLASRTRPDGVEEEDLHDLYPVVIPQNLSPQLDEFIAETDRCTSKRFFALDTMPHLRPQQAYPDGHWVDAWTNPALVLFFLDAAHIHETIFAHEVAHVWIDVVEDCEDYRILKDLSNTGRVFQWTNVQSFVLDNRVNEVLRERGFDMSVIEADIRETLASLSMAVLSGYRPPNAREAAFLASTLATAMLDHETGGGSHLQVLDRTSQVFQCTLSDVHELACRLATSIRRHGYGNRDSIRNAVDACARLLFDFTGDPLDFANDLVEEKPTEDCEDKFPLYLPSLPLQAKLEIGKAMARLKIRAGAEYRLSYSPGGSVQVQFSREDGSWTAPVLLQSVHRLPEAFGFSQQHSPRQRGGATVNKPITPVSARNPAPPGAKPVQIPVALPIMPSVPSIPWMPGGTPTRRSYSPGLALFLSRARLAEQLGGEHPYGYAMNNPIVYIDPSGLRCTGKKPICPPQWNLLCASTWRCNEYGMGTTCLACAVKYGIGPYCNNSCVCPNYRGPITHTCDCNNLLCGSIIPVPSCVPANQAVAMRDGSYKGYHVNCGDQFLVMLPNKPETKRQVTVVDVGPSKDIPDVDIDINTAVFGKDMKTSYWVCVQYSGHNADVVWCPRCFNKTTDDCSKC